MHNTAINQSFLHNMWEKTKDVVFCRKTKTVFRKINPLHHYWLASLPDSERIVGQNNQASRASLLATGTLCLFAYAWLGGAADLVAGSRVTRVKINEAVNNTPWNGANRHGFLVYNETPFFGFDFTRLVVINDERESVENSRGSHQVVHVRQVSVYVPKKFTDQNTGKQYYIAAKESRYSRPKLKYQVFMDAPENK